MNKKNILIVLIALIVVGALSFYGGEYVNSKKVSANPYTQRGMNNRAGNIGGAAFGGMRNGGLSMGEVVSVDKTSMTIKTRDGGSKIVFFTDTTPIMKSVSGTSSDITVGKEVTITGASNPDGSLNAESIQIRQTPQVDNKNQ